MLHKPLCALDLDSVDHYCFSPRAKQFKQPDHMLYSSHNIQPLPDEDLIMSVLLILIQILRVTI